MDSKVLSDSKARQLVIDVLVAYGATNSEAGIVADHLVDADLSGVRSHGLMRVPQYVDEIRSGEIRPDVLPSMVRQGGNRVDLDGNRCFGQVGCTWAVREGESIARQQGLALATVRNTGHVGRIGAYAESLGRAGMLSLIFCSGPRSGHRVAPFNGREGRLATNPIAFSIPTKSDPIVGDFSTASSPEGRIRNLRDLGLEAPPETLLDASGQPTTDPNVLYQSVPGTIMPLGGFRLGHRGFALGLLVEALATLLPGDETNDESRIGNNVTFIIVSVDSSFTSRVESMTNYILTSPRRGEDLVALPGMVEQQHRAGAHMIEINTSTWTAIKNRAEVRGISIEDILSSNL